MRRNRNLLTSQLDEDNTMTVVREYPVGTRPGRYSFCDEVAMENLRGMVSAKNTILMLRLMIIVIGCLIIMAFAFFLKNEYEEFKEDARAASVSEDEVYMNFGVEQKIGKHVGTVEAEMRAKGFSDILLKPAGGLFLGLLKKKGQVSGVSIAGNSEFAEGDIYKKADTVIIEYYSMWYEV